MKKILIGSIFSLIAMKSKGDFMNEGFDDNGQLYFRLINQKL